MSQPVYDIAGWAKLEMRRVFNDLYGKMSRRELIHYKGVDRFPTLELVREIYWDNVKRIMASAHVEIDPDSPIAIQCKNCKRVDMIKRDVLTFKCHCSPNEEQWVVKSRNVDLGV